MATMCDNYVSYGWIVELRGELTEGGSFHYIKYYIGVDKLAALHHAVDETERDHGTVESTSIHPIDRCHVALPAYCELHAVSPSDLE